MMSLSKRTSPDNGQIVPLRVAWPGRAGEIGNGNLIQRKLIFYRISLPRFLLI